MGIHLGRYPQELIEFIACNEVDTLVFRRGVNCRKYDLGCPTPKKVTDIFIKNLDYFMVSMKHAPMEISDPFEVRAFNQGIHVATGKWQSGFFTDDKKVNTETGGILVFLGCTFKEENKS